MVNIERFLDDLNTADMFQVFGIEYCSYPDEDPEEFEVKGRDLKITALIESILKSVNTTILFIEIKTGETKYMRVVFNEYVT